MTKWKLKGCPRCKGDLASDRDKGKWYELCLQCGYRRDLKVVGQENQLIEKEEAAKKPAQK